MDLGLEGRVALVAGGSKGIGKGVALHLAREGASVAICARGKEELETTAEEISAITERRVLSIQADMSVLKDIQRFVDTAADSFGRLDILVYSANTLGGGSFDQISDESWQEHIAVKLLGCVRCAREVIPYMQKNNWGRIIIIAGMAARVIRPGGVDNGPVCGGIANFGKQIANELAGKGIRVNTIHPGYANTPRGKQIAARLAKEQGITTEEFLEQARERSPIGRIIEAEDIANLTLFLCSQQASAVTGQSIAVDGGAGTAISY